jgi:hypothetical protein
MQFYIFLHPPPSDKQLSGVHKLTYQVQHYQLINNEIGLTGRSKGRQQLSRRFENAKRGAP